MFSPVNKGIFQLSPDSTKTERRLDSRNWRFFTQRFSAFFFATFSAPGLISTAKASSKVIFERIEMGIIPVPVPISIRTSNEVLVAIRMAFLTRSSVSNRGMRTFSLTKNR